MRNFLTGQLDFGLSLKSCQKFFSEFLWDYVWISHKMFEGLNVELACLKTIWELLTGLARAVLIFVQSFLTLFLNSNYTGVAFLFVFVLHSS